LLEHVDLLVVNEIEARVLGGELERYQGLLACTFGARGAVLRRKGREIARARPPRVEVVDTTGAGDAFTAALTTALVSDMNPGDALQFACVAGALATTRLGAQSSPTRQDVQQLT
jgi:ribokinase